MPAEGYSKEGFGVPALPALPSAAVKYLVQVADASVPNAQALGALATGGLLKFTTITGVVARAVPGTDYQVPLVAGTDYQVPLVAGTDYAVPSVVPNKAAKYIVQQADGTLLNAQAMGVLATGLVKNTTTTGVQSIAVGDTDYQVPLTFANGLTRTANAVANDLVTGKAGGQSVTGGTAASEGLTLLSTSHATKGSVTIGATPLAVFTTNMAITSAAGAVLDSVLVPANTVTVSGTTTIATALGFNYVTIKAPTITDASVCTVTSSATVAISGAPVAAGSVTITNPYALWVQAGAVLFDATVTTTLAPFKLLNGKALSGIEVQVTGTVATGFVVRDAAGLQRVAMGYAVANADWSASSAAGDAVIVGPTTAGKKLVIQGGTGSTAGVALLSAAGSATCAVSDAVGAVLGFGGNTLTINGTNATVAGPLVATSYVAGSVASAGNLTLSSTSHATKGYIVPDSPIRSNAANGTRIYSPTNTTTNQGYILLDEASGVTIGYSANNSISMNGVQLTLNAPTANTGTIQSVADKVIFYNAAATEAGRFTINGNLLLGTITDVASTKVRILASKTVVAAAGAVWDGVDTMTSTLTLTGATNVTTATGVNLAVFRAPTITDASVSVVSFAATVAIAGPPVAAGSVTITNAWSLWVQAGNLRLDGKLSVPTAQTQTTIGANGAATALTALPLGYLKIDVNGTAAIVPYYNA